MRRQKEKKLVSVANYSFIFPVIEDISYVERKTDSEIIEEILLSKRLPLLPVNPSAAQIVVTLYSNLSKPDGLKNAWRSLFAYASAGVGGKARVTNLSPLVELLRDYCWGQEADCERKDKEYPLNHLKVQWNSIVKHLQDTELTKYQKASLEYYEANNNIKFALDLLDTLERFPYECSLISNMLNFIVDSWPLISNYGRTCRALVDMVDLVQPANTPDHRRAFCDRLYIISRSWPTE